MSLELNSFSSSLMLGITLYRNQPGVTNKHIAQAGYALAAAVSTIETAAAVAFSALALVMYPFSHTFCDYAVKWLSSSAFALGWSVAGFLLNLFVLQLPADEKSARQMFQSGDLTKIPRGATV